MVFYILSQIYSVLKYMFQLFIAFIKLFFWCLRRIYLYCLLGIMILLIAYSIYAFRVIRKYKYEPYQVINIFDRNYRQVTVTGAKLEEYMTYEQIPKKVKQTIIYTEDKNFYTNIGLSFTGILRAIGQSIRKFFYFVIQKKEFFHIAGGSTITQQVIKLIFLTEDKLFARKIKELIYAPIITLCWSKQKIMEIYVNKVYLSYGIYGISLASKIFFYKNIDQLNYGEIAVLVAMLKDPSEYSPFYNYEQCIYRRNYILKTLYKNKIINQEEYNLYINQELYINLDMHNINKWFFINHEVRQEIIKNFGKDSYMRGGFDVHLTIDSDINQICSKSLEEICLGLEKNEKWAGPVGIAKKKSELVKFYAGSLVYPVRIINKEGEYEGKRNGKLSSIFLCQYEVNINDVLYLTRDDNTVINKPSFNGQVTMIAANGDIIASVSGCDPTYNQTFIDKRQRHPGSIAKVFDIAAIIDILELKDLYIPVYDRPLVVKNNKCVFPDLSTYLLLDQSDQKDDINTWIVHNWDNKFLGEISLGFALEHSRNIPFVDIILNRVGLEKFGRWMQNAGVLKHEPRPSSILGCLVF